MLFATCSAQLVLSLQHDGLLVPNRDSHYPVCTINACAPICEASVAVMHPNSTFQEPFAILPKTILKSLRPLLVAGISCRVATLIKNGFLQVWLWTETALKKPH